MTYIEKEISLLASSDTANGAEDVSSNGDRFTISLTRPIQIPQNAVNVNVEIDQATIWWTIANIETDVNDTLYFNNGATDETIVIEQGLYDIVGLNAAIDRGMVNLGETSGSITLTADNNANKSVLTIATNTWTVDMRTAKTDTFRDLLGFDQQLFNPTVDNESFTSENVAAFNTVNYFLIHSDITDKGIRINNSYNQTVAQILINKAPGSQIVYEPFRPAKTSARHLKGAIRDQLSFWLTDDSNDSVNTAGETWSARFRLSWMEKVE